MDKNALTLYAVTDRAWTDDLCRDVEAAIRGGATFVQIREKELGCDEFLAEAKRIVAICRAHGVPCVINDNVDVAIASGADGVHVVTEQWRRAE